MIKTENLSFSYKDEIIISNLSVELKKGCIYCIMGMSGVGKTTFMNLISGLLTDYSGKISGTENMKKSFIFQENRLLPWLNVYDNLKYVTDDEEKIKKALEDTSLSDDSDKLANELSGGMARRAAIARAAAFDGDIFFIDEPLYGLDVKTSQGILELIKNTVKNKTAFVITHCPEEAFILADKLIFIKSKPVTTLEITDISDYKSADEIKAKLF